MIKHVGDKTNFRCASISSTYPSQSVGWSVRNTFVFPFCQRLWVLTKRWENIAVDNMEVDMVVNTEVDMVADMEVDKVADMDVDKVADMLANDKKNRHRH